MTKKVKS